MSTTIKEIHPTTTKGDYGVVMVTADLIKRGYDVLTPVSHTSPYDLVVYTGNKFYRLQVKFRNESSYGSVEVTPRRLVKNCYGAAAKYEPNKDFDILAIYVPEKGIAYIGRDEYPTETIRLRLREPKNNQKKKVRMFDDYMKFNF